MYTTQAVSVIYTIQAVSVAFTTQAMSVVCITQAVSVVCNTQANFMLECGVWQIPCSLVAQTAEVVD